MRTLTEAEFLSRVKRVGIGLDPRYPQSAILTFSPDTGDERFWCVPPAPEQRPYFVGTLLELMGDWQSCYAWRHLGSWHDVVDSLRLNEVVEFHILKGLDLPLGTTEVVEFARDQTNQLVTLIFSTTIFGWSVEEDLYIVPDHGRYILKTDHHGVIHVAFREHVDVAQWVSEMEKRGFSLPEELPDITFKQPAWMKHED